MINKIYKRITAKDFTFLINILLYLVAVIIALPLFFLLSPHLPNIALPLGQGIHLEHLLFSVLVVGLSIYVVIRLKHLVLIILGIGLISIIVSSSRGNYSFQDAFQDYVVSLYNLQNNPVAVPLMADDYEPFQDAYKVAEAVNLQGVEVRNYAVKIGTKYFSDFIDKHNRSLIQSFSIFKEINNNWVYVSDPVGEEYFAAASETISQQQIDGKFNGDCDDHAILMAACLKFVGAEVRLVRTTHHIYPELRVGTKDELDKAIFLIRHKLFISESKGKSVYYHVDQDGIIWLNFDYTGRAPGGKFLQEDIVGILEF
ncbi:MAG: hypothetical protein OER04_01225 [Cyclobacteriaceae bacterium]|nr:hypothetical protein [Cyclobacteriaceae bacterium]